MCAAAVAMSGAREQARGIEFNATSLERLLRPLAQKVLFRSCYRIQRLLFMFVASTALPVVDQRLTFWPKLRWPRGKNTALGKTTTKTNEATQKTLIIHRHPRRMQPTLSRTGDCHGRG